MASATQIAPSASGTEIPSGATVSSAMASDGSSAADGGPNRAQSRRGPSVPSSPIAKADSRLPKVSATTRSPPVSAGPFAKCNGSLATDTVPSGATRSSGAAARGAPFIRSKPKVPTQSPPPPSTTMSLSRCSVWPDRSAWVTRVPSDSRRRIRRSRMDTTSSRPSGSQPSPDGCCGTSASVRRSDPSARAESTRWV